MTTWFKRFYVVYPELILFLLAGVGYAIAAPVMDTCPIKAAGVPRAAWWKSMLLPLVLLAAGTGAASSSQAETVPALGEWHEFQGMWTAVGNRQAIGLGGERRASIADLDGSPLLSGPRRPELGFRTEAIVLTDSATGMVGRAVWTVDRGDQLYSELRANTPPRATGLSEHSSAAAAVTWARPAIMNSPGVF
jgi:hypothetical protein